MSGAREPVGTLEVALAHARRLLATQPVMAAQQAREILKASAGNPLARLLLGQAERLAGHTQAALDVLEPLAHEQPNAAAAHLQLGIARAEARRIPEAVAALRRAVQLQPRLADAWRLLADLLDGLGDAGAADEARARYLKAATQDARLMQAAAALVANELPVAETLLRAHLQARPTDIAALRMLAEVAARLGRYA